MRDDIRPWSGRGTEKRLVLENYCSFYLAVIANRLNRRSSATYLERYGIGVAEWRCMVLLSLEPGASAARVGEVTGMNKSIVSRSLSRLESAGYVGSHEGSKSRKPRPLALTEAGLELHGSALEFALGQEEAIRAGLSEDDVAELLRLLRTVHGNCIALTETTDR